MDMLVLSSFQSRNGGLPLDGKSVPVHFVPTMGALHAGHGAHPHSTAKAGEDGEVVVSVYVNPTQFNDDGDLAAYPRTRDADAALARRFGSGRGRVSDFRGNVPGGRSQRGPRSQTMDPAQCWKRRTGRDTFDGVVAVVRTLFLATRQPTPISERRIGSSWR